MTPTEKHRETAEALIASRIDSMCMTWDHSFGLMDEQQREGLRRNFRQIAYHDLTSFTATALAKAEREGMKRGVNDTLDALTAHELYQYRPKAFAGFIAYARSELLSECGEG